MPRTPMHEGEIPTDERFVGRLIAQARAKSGAEVHLSRFQDITYAEVFDAVGACVSLLHVPRVDLPDVFKRLARGMKPGGVWYASFKCG